MLRDPWQVLGGQDVLACRQAKVDDDFAVQLVPPVRPQCRVVETVTVEGDQPAIVDGDTMPDSRAGRPGRAWQ